MGDRGNEENYGDGSPNGNLNEPEPSWHPRL